MMTRIKGRGRGVNNGLFRLTWFVNTAHYFKKPKIYWFSCWQYELTHIVHLKVIRFNISTNQTFNVIKSRFFLFTLWKEFLNLFHDGRKNSSTGFQSNLSLVFRVCVRWKCFVSLIHKRGQYSRILWSLRKRIQRKHTRSRFSLYWNWGIIANHFTSPKSD